MVNTIEFLDRVSFSVQPQKPVKSFVHPLVEEAKSRDVVSSPPPKSPRSSKVTKSPSSPKSPRHDVGVDELDTGFRLSKKETSPLTRQYKKRHHASHIVPPLELYKLQQGDGEGVQLSPREKYDGFSVEEAMLSPRSRPLSIDTKSYTYPTECPPSPPHEQLDHQWFDRRSVTLMGRYFFCSFFWALGYTLQISLSLSLSLSPSLSPSLPPPPLYYVKALFSANHIRIF